VTYSSGIFLFVTVSSLLLQLLPNQNVKHYIINTLSRFVSFLYHKRKDRGRYLRFSCDRGCLQTFSAIENLCITAQICLYLFYCSILFPVNQLVFLSLKRKTQRGNRHKDNPACSWTRGSRSHIALPYSLFLRLLRRCFQPSLRWRILRRQYP